MIKWFLDCLSLYEIIFYLVFLWCLIAFSFAMSEPFNKTELNQVVKQFNTKSITYEQ